MNRLEILEACEGHPTKYENLYFHYSSVFEYIYVDDEFVVEARNCRDLKFKLSLKGITLREREVVELSTEDSILSGLETDFVQASEIEVKSPKKFRAKTFNNSFHSLYGTSDRELSLRREIANRHC